MADDKGNQRAISGAPSISSCSFSPHRRRVLDEWTLSDLRGCSGVRHGSQRRTAAGRHGDVRERAGQTARRRWRLSYWGGRRHGADGGGGSGSLSRVERGGERRSSGPGRLQLRACGGRVERRCGGTGPCRCSGRRRGPRSRRGRDGGVGRQERVRVQHPRHLPAVCVAHRSGALRVGQIRHVRLGYLRLQPRIVLVKLLWQHESAGATNEAGETTPLSLFSTSLAPPSHPPKAPAAACPSSPIAKCAHRDVVGRSAPLLPCATGRPSTTCRGSPSCDRSESSRTLNKHKHGQNRCGATWTSADNDRKKAKSASPITMLAAARCSRCSSCARGV